MLSKSAEAYDLGDKAEHYRRLSPLAEYILVSQGKYQIEYYVRQSDNRWPLWEANELQGMMTLPAIDCALSLAAGYDKVASSNK